MATDLGRIVRELTAFYDFAGKTLVIAGAGGGQIVEYARPARHVVAIDRDAAALDRLRSRLDELGMAGTFTFVHRDFLEDTSQGDVVVLEFCLHEMLDPQGAIAHARRLAPDVVVIDHASGSRWAWDAAMDAGVQMAWEAVEAAGIRRDRNLDAEQRFDDFPQLATKLGAQGSIFRERIAVYRDRTPISIPMPYRIALL